MTIADKDPTYSAEELPLMAEAFQRRSDPEGARWILAMDDGGHLIHPYPLPQRLFRGQNQRYSPCQTSIARGIDPRQSQLASMAAEDQALIILRAAKSIWFHSELEGHPAVKWARAMNISINMTALAQHYELETGYLDMSHDFNVAAFFATCRLEGGCWKPALPGIGVVYRFDIERVPDHLRALYAPVGLQPLPRPKEQGAWVVEVPLGFDYETHPAVSWIRFHQNARVSEYFLQMFEEGRRLFPPDPVADIAAQVKNSRSIAERFVDAALKGGEAEPGGLADVRSVKAAISRLTAFGDAQRLMEAQDIAELERSWRARADEFGRYCKVIPIRLEEVKAADGSQPVAADVAARRR